MKDGADMDGLIGGVGHSGPEHTGVKQLGAEN